MTTLTIQTTNEYAHWLMQEFAKRQDVEVEKVEQTEPMDETEYLLSTKANRERLLETLEDKKNNYRGYTTYNSLEELKKAYGVL